MLLIFGALLLFYLLAVNSDLLALVLLVSSPEASTQLHLPVLLTDRFAC